MGLAARGEGTPSPSISGIIQLAGDYKLNLGAQSLAGKILISKGLPIVLAGSIPATGRMRSPPTVTASTMIARLRGCAQGQMSHAAVEKKALRGQPVEKLCRSRSVAGKLRNCPTQAKSGLEWATRELILRSLFATPRGLPCTCRRDLCNLLAASHRRRVSCPPGRHPTLETLATTPLCDVQLFAGC
jgi:hypothetical protein